MPNIKRKIVEQEVFEYAGVNYPTWDEASAAQRKAENSVEKFFKMTHGPRYSNTLEGIFRIETEGPINVGERGPFTLAHVHGAYLEAVRYAVALDRFWGYGPGSVIKIDIVELK